jgi:hypothetical protein
MSEKTCPSRKKADSPKSVAFSGAPSDASASSQFSGLRSRCMTPIAWQCCTTPTIVRATAAVSFSV